MSRLRKVDAPFTTVDNSVAEDCELSFRARGILLYLLAKPDGWSVRAEAIARDGKEGRDAVQTALRELGARGHYRIIRYRDGGPGGQWKTETQIAHRPVPEWAADWAARGGGPLVVKETPQVSAETGIPGLGDEADDEPPEDDLEPENGFPVVGVTGNPGAGNPTAGNPTAGSSAAVVSTLSNETEQDTSSLRSDAATSDDALPGLKVVGGTEAETPTLNERAERLLRAWWDWRKANRPHTLPSQGYPGIKGMVKTALANGKPDRLVGQGLSRLADSATAFSGGTLATAMRDIARMPDAPEEFRPFAGEDDPAPRRSRRTASYDGKAWANGGDGGWGEFAAASQAALGLEE